MAEDTVRTRADLVCLLTSAAELEHSLMVQYLFAARIRSSSSAGWEASSKSAKLAASPQAGGMSLSAILTT